MEFLYYPKISIEKIFSSTSSCHSPQTRRLGYTKLPGGVNISVDGCLSLPDELMTFQCQLGLAPETQNPARDKGAQVMDGWKIFSAYFNVFLFENSKRCLRALTLVISF